ncbi:acyl-CoA carboxylase epsilon subunit [Microbispora sp. GKU 823]|uniref:acyl-CoA carboxylase epsilon subunit n=1 Tax=Microbispora sp. GKU 823 TaxID=1652100 RepID=UPI0009A296CF|nr:acyl-CoA carboxylase epsilon subunit [Microbispora sp. GKU 823]
MSSREPYLSIVRGDATPEETAALVAALAARAAARAPARRHRKRSRETGGTRHIGCAWDSRTAREPGAGPSSPAGDDVFRRHPRRLRTDYIAGTGCQLARELGLSRKRGNIVSRSTSDESRRTPWPSRTSAHMALPQSMPFSWTSVTFTRPPVKFS